MRGNVNCFFPTPTDLVGVLSSGVGTECDQLVDLGAGGGALAALFDTGVTERIAIEKQASFIEDLSKCYSKVIIGDVTKSPLKDLVPEILSQTTMISNPPFGATSSTYELQQLLRQQNLVSEGYVGGKVRLEAVFLARALEACGVGSKLAFIFPAIFLHGKHFVAMRNELVRRHGLTRIYCSLTRPFANTEVEVVIFWLHSGAGDLTNGLGVKLEFPGGASQTLSRENFIEGLAGAKSGPASQLDSISHQLWRGTLCSKELKGLGAPHIHSTHLNDKHGSTVKCAKPAQGTPGAKVAEDGDILIARVGTRVIGRASVFSGDRALISDSVIALRVEDELRNEVFKALASDRIQSWFRRAAKGSCAKLLTYDTIRSSPIFV